MKQLDLIFTPENFETYVFNNLDLSKATEPLQIEREEPLPEEEQFFEKKKSEILEYENEDYIALLEQEQDPFIITDAESKSMCGKYQNMADNSGTYFAFINTGKALKVVPISKWYRFVQRNQFAETSDVEGLEKNLTNAEFEIEESESEHEIDYDQHFDDDDEEENYVLHQKEKKLSSSGKKLQGLVTHLEEIREEPENEIEEEKNEVVEEEKPKKLKQNVGLTKEDIKRVFKGKSMTIKDLLKTLSSQFKLDETDKILIRNFLKESCEASVDVITGETVLKLKK